MKANHEEAIKKLQQITEECNKRSERQLALLNKLRALNGKKQVKSWEEHQQLKSIGL